MSDDPVRPALPLSNTAISAVGPHTPTIEAEGRRRNPYIQWLRAVAALLVMLYHTATYQNLRLHDGRLRLVFGDWCGFFGVALFFAISGYLMSIAVRVQKPGLFLMHRIVRIYPAYIAVAAGFLVTAAALGQRFPYQPSLFLLMPARISKPILGIEWTLLFEISFYVMLFCVSLAGRAKRIDRIACLWIGAILVSSLLWPDPGDRLFQPIYRLLFLVTSLPMAAGLLIPRLLTLRVPVRWLFVLAALPWFALPLAGDRYEALRLVFAASAVSLVWASVAAAQSARIIHLGLAGRVLARLGDCSYALYLCHKPVIDLLYSRDHGIASPVMAMAAVTLSLAVAYAVGFVDVALYGRLKQWVGRWRESRVHAATLAYTLLFAVISGQGAVAYYTRDSHQADAHFGTTIAAAGPVGSADEASAAAIKAGFQRSDTIIGHVDRIARVPEENRSVFDIWGLDASPARLTVSAGLFRRGVLVATLSPAFTRADLAERYGVKVKTGFHYEVVEPCDDAAVIVVLYTRDRRFTVLPSAGQSSACPG